MEINKDQWPAGLDAMIAAPQHHKILFENEKVRVLDANIPAGEITALHTHSFRHRCISSAGAILCGMMPMET